MIEPLTQDTHGTDESAGISFGGKAETEPHSQEIATPGYERCVNDEELVVLGAQAEHAESQHQAEGTPGDEWLVAVRVEQGSAEASETELKEGLDTALVNLARYRFHAGRLTKRSKRSHSCTKSDDCPLISGRGQTHSE